MPKPFDNTPDIHLINRFDAVFLQARNLVQERNNSEIFLSDYKENNAGLLKKIKQLEAENRILEKKYQEETDYSAKLIKIVGNKLKQTKSSESASVLIEELIIEIDSLITQLREYK